MSNQTYKCCVVSGEPLTHCVTKFASMFIISLSLHPELGDTEAVLKEYDTILVKSVTPDNRLGLLDASSLLWRLNLMGVDVGNRWQQVTDSLKVHVGKHGSSWLVGGAFSTCTHAHTHTGAGMMLT